MYGRIKRFYILILICIGIGLYQFLDILQPVQARPALEETLQPAIDAYIEQQMHDLQIPGLALAIVHGDQMAYVRGYGVADDSGRPVTPQTPFLIASLSKSFTALGIMQLVEEGKVRLDAPIQEYLPWFQVANRDASAQLTIRHLLYHSSGFSELQGYKRNLDRNSADHALEASVFSLSRSRLNNLPGERFEYSNTNYDILGLLIQTISGKSYEDYVDEKIFAPLNMQNSFTSLNEARAGEVSSGFTSFFGMTIKYDRFMPYSRTVVPSAGLFSSAKDMAHYLYTHLNQGRYQDGAMILSPAGMTELLTPGVKINEQVSYAMGWTAFPFTAAARPPGQPIFIGLSHGDQWANFRSLMLLVPDQKLGVVVLMNKNNYRQGVAYDNIGWNTALLAMGLEPSISPPNKISFLQDDQLILAIVLLLLTASFIWSARSLTKATYQNKTGHRSSQSLALLVVLPVLDLALAGYLLLVYLPQSATSLPLALSFEPDTGLMYFLLLVFTLGWGTIRTLLAIPKLLGAEKFTLPASGLPDK